MLKVLHRAHLPTLQHHRDGKDTVWIGRDERWDFLLLKEELRNAVICESSDLQLQVWLSSTPLKYCYQHLDAFKQAGKASSFGQADSWGELIFPVPPKLRAPLFPAEQGPNPAPVLAPQPATELPTALHHCIHSNSSKIRKDLLLSPLASLHRGRRDRCGRRGQMRAPTRSSSSPAADKQKSPKSSLNHP